MTISLVLVDVFPPPWSDEMVFGVTARSLFETGRLQTPVVVGMERFTFWVPPLYIAFLGGFFEVFGFGFVTMRVFSIMCGVVVLIVTYVIARQLKLPLFLIVIVLTLVVVDPFLLRYSKVGRMDSLCMALILGSLACHIGWVATRWRSLNLCAVIGASLAVAVHPMGLIAVAGLLLHRLMLRLRGKIDSLSFLAPGIALVVILIALSGYWLQDTSEFLAQMKFQFTRKAGRGISSPINWLERYWALPALLLVTVGGLFSALFQTFRKGWSSMEGAVALFTLLAFIGVTTAFELSYPVYYVPLVSLSVGLALRDIFARKFILLSKFAVGFLGLAILNAVLFDGYFAYLYVIKLKDETSVSSVAQEVSNLLPLRSTALLIGVPCLFFELHDRRGDVRLYAPIAIRPVNEERLVEKVDHIVTTMAFGASFDAYMAVQLEYWRDVFHKNGKNIRLIGYVGHQQPYAYKGAVYKVK